VRVRRLKETGADLLICGAISNMIGNLIEAEGICIIPWVSGGVEEVLDAFAHEDLTDARYRMPGCRGRGMGYRRGRDRGTWGGPERGSLRGGRCGRRRQGELKQDQGESK
jgi:predicted Fe-Mo cluster-binding NifX family protein